MSFKDIKGQAKALGILEEDAKHARLANAYLFSGPESVGKKMAAINFAKALNCQEAVFDSCGECPSCIKIEKNQHPDVFMIDASTVIDSDRSNTGDSDAVKIGHIRQLQKSISLRPYEGKFKVFIIDDAHNLTAEASNALLKVLEEPPSSSLIILISAKPNLLFKTIISRCRVLKFYPLNRAELEEFLKKDYSLDSHMAHFLAFFCEGRIGRALSLKDTDILAQKNKVIDNFVLAHNFRADDFSVQDRSSIRDCLNILATWFRDIYMIKTGTAYSELINADRKADLVKLMQKFSFLDLDEIFRVISSSVLRLEQNVNVKLMLSNLRMELWRG